MINTLFGLPVIVSQHAEKIERTQVRFPRTKKKRIQKKWSKQERNYKITAIPLAFRTPMGIIVHPSIWRMLNDPNTRGTYFKEIPYVC